MRYFLLLLIFSACWLTACDSNDMEKDVESYLNLKCKIQSIEDRHQAGEINFLETENEKEPLFDSLDNFWYRYRTQRDEFDSLVDLRATDYNCP